MNGTRKNLCVLATIEKTKLVLLHVNTFPKFTRKLTVHKLTMAMQTAVCEIECILENLFFPYHHSNEMLTTSPNYYSYITLEHVKYDQ